MKHILFFIVFAFASQSFASVPFCSIGEFIDGFPTTNSKVAEFKKGQELEISTFDLAAKLIANWDEENQFYQMSLSIGDIIVNSIIELPAKSGFLNYQANGKNYSAQCRFELN